MNIALAIVIGTADSRRAKSKQAKSPPNIMQASRRRPVSKGFQCGETIERDDVDVINVGKSVSHNT